ncbi:glycosyltransferase family 61 protein [Hymenobacter sp. BT683]|uniref:Glycosyltransferase family 61 protein n=1 Tax=Hymenobacter jeongseonensis TaxID=2791027 RepID=A0ABS0ID33_9BACT|nr:glycosyltransferase family 61 protein [Hymenobacter jeongseonensis]MBF9236265.1 glycosyltransferase family 61 protein [Hymenobacter jeongseonensis]
MPDLLNRVKRRAGRVLREWLPHRLHYRPIGIHDSSRELARHASSGARYWPVVPAYTSRLEVPTGFNEAVSVYESVGHGKPCFEQEMSEAFVLALAHGRLYADNWDSVAVIAADNKLVGDVSFQHTRRGWTMTAPAQNNIFEQLYFEEPVPVAGTVLSLLAGGGAAMGNYYHWLIDSVPRLHLVREAGLFAEIDYFLVYDKHCSFVRESLLALGIRPEQLIDVATHRHLRAEQLLVTSPVRGNGRHLPFWLGPFLRRAYLPASLTGARFSPRVFISRRDAAMRRLLNESAVEEVLREFNFHSYVLSDLSFAEKVHLFSGAHALIGMLGAGMTNLVFATPGTPVLELHPDAYVGPESMEICYRVGLPYHWLTGQPSAASTNHNAARHLDLWIDPDQLRAAICRLLAAVPANAKGSSIN